MHKQASCGCNNPNLVEWSDLIYRDAPLIPSIHYGLIRSGNTFLKNATRRGELSKKHPYLCFETQASGVVNRFRCLVVRGICDYADSHSNEVWQPYAALVAAAYGRAVLGQIPPSVVQRETPLKDIADEVNNGK